MKKTIMLAFGLSIAAIGSAHARGGAGESGGGSGGGESDRRPYHSMLQAGNGGKSYGAANSGSAAAKPTIKIESWSWGSTNDTSPPPPPPPPPQHDDDCMSCD